jgi:hypothetical protein
VTCQYVTGVGKVGEVSGSIDCYNMDECFEWKYGISKLICVFVFTDCEKALVVTDAEHKSMYLNSKVLPLQCKLKT